MIHRVKCLSEIYKYANDMLALVEEMSDSISKFNKC